MTSRIIMLMMEGGSYREDLRRLVESITKQHPRLLLLSYNTGYEILDEEFRKSGVDVSRIRYIDAVTPVKQEVPGCVYIGSGTSYTEIAIQLTKNIEEYKPAVVLIDSLSSIIVDESTKSQLIQDLINKIRVSDTFGILTVMKEHANNQLFKDSKMWVDCIVDYEKWVGRC